MHRANPPYTYTVGLASDGHPEPVVVGMHPTAGHRELTPLAEAVLAGHRLVDLRDLPKSFGCVFRFVPVTPGAIDIGVADVVLGQPAPAIQCVWSAHGRYPGEVGYDDVAYRQPLLEPACWLPESREVAV